MVKTVEYIQKVKYVEDVDEKGETTIYALPETSEDPQELIRCKNCAYGVQIDYSNYYVCSKPFAGPRETHVEDWFCADGKQKT